MPRIELAGLAQAYDQDPVEVDACRRQQLDQLAFGAGEAGCLERAFDRALGFLVEIVEETRQFLGLGGADRRAFPRPGSRTLQS